MPMEAARIESLLRRTDAAAQLLPEWDEAAKDMEAWRRSERVRQLLASLPEPIQSPGGIPRTSYTLYREFQRRGERRGYEAPYFRKRALLVAAVMRAICASGTEGSSAVDAAQDLIWDACEETTWVLPAHEWTPIDLFASETAFCLSETDALLGERLAAEIRARIRAEVERRVLTPYLNRPETDFWWHRGTNNWNGVCNSSIGAAALRLEPDATRLSRIVARALAGLDVFIEKAFTADGGSTEGAAYWQYGLSNYVCFAEMLRARTAGGIDLLSREKLRRIAEYPLNVLLSPGRVASFSDCPEEVQFSPWLVSMLARRTGSAELASVLAGADPLHARKESLWVPAAVRNMLWWDGSMPEAAFPRDSWLKETAVARLVAAGEDGRSVVLAAKAGHNAECHNHNDVGSFIVHAAGETLLCDPGAGLYSRDYFSAKRYENPFANSYGHSVPRVGGALQSSGAEFRGSIAVFDPEGSPKRLGMEIGGAYAAAGLRISRAFELAASGALTIEDVFRFAGSPLGIEEAFVTWCEAAAEGGAVRIRGRSASALLTVEEPAGAAIRVERMEDACRANAKDRMLTRIAFVLPPSAGEMRARVRIGVAFEA